MDNQIFIKRVWMPDGDIVSANLVYRDRPVLILDTGEEIIDDKNEITYEMTHEYIVNKKGETVQVPLKKPVRLYLTSRLAIMRKYSKDATEEDLDIYPPSSHGFYGRLVRGIIDAEYIIQDIVDEDNYWLTIINHETNEMYGAHKIRPYEYGVIRLKTWQENFYELISALSPPNPEKTIKEVLGVIDETDLSWAEIQKITGGIIPSSFKRAGTARNTLSNIIPIEKFSQDTQEEILAFLVWVAKEKIPESDLIEFLETVYVLPLFRTLFGRHLQFIMDNRTPPHYIDLIKEAAMRQSGDTKLLPDEKGRWSPDYILQRKIEDIGPDWQEEATDMITSLNDSNKIVTTLPIKKSSSQNKTSQRKRLIMNEIGLRLRTHVRPRALGLKELIYIGSAHRWPHIHLAFSIRLEGTDSRSPYIHNMVMPNSAAEQVKRLLPGTIDIEWSTRTLNPNLYSKSKSRWTMQKTAITESIYKSISMKNLCKEFGLWNGRTTYMPNKSDVRLLDMASSFFYLSDLESKAAQKYWKTNEDESRNRLTHFRDLGIINILYWYDRRLALTPVFSLINGPESKVCSITRFLLKYTPTAIAMIANGGKTSAVVSRVSVEDKSSLADILTFADKESELDIKHTFPSAHRNYTSDLFQRILKEDGTWSDDVSAFLSQIRSAPKSN